MKKSIDSTYGNHGGFLGWGSGPDADWKVMFSIFIFALLICAATSVLLYRDAKKSFDSESEATASPLNKEQLRRTANFYQEQKLNFETARTSSVTIPDPSM
jgi:hypothetical protein